MKFFEKRRKKELTKSLLWHDMMDKKYLMESYIDEILQCGEYSDEGRQACINLKIAADQYAEAKKRYYAVKKGFKY